MVFHELATNAAKYGALSIAGGRVTVSWRVAHPASDAACLHLEWCERDGPTFEQPRKSGFGSRLIQAGIVHELGGEVHPQFTPDGVCYKIRVPLKEAGQHANCSKNDRFPDIKRCS
jgi:two-component sensor histidine kinase